MCPQSCQVLAWGVSAFEQLLLFPCWTVEVNQQWGHPGNEVKDVRPWLLKTYWDCSCFPVPPLVPKTPQQCVWFFFIHASPAWASPNFLKKHWVSCICLFPTVPHYNQSPLRASTVSPFAVVPRQLAYNRYSINTCWIRSGMVHWCGCCTIVATPCTSNMYMKNVFPDARIQEYSDTHHVS